MWKHRELFGICQSKLCENDKMILKIIFHTANANYLYRIYGCGGIRTTEKKGTSVDNSYLCNIFWNHCPRPMLDDMCLYEAKSKR